MEFTWPRPCKSGLRDRGIGVRVPSQPGASYLAAKVSPAEQGKMIFPCRKQGVPVIKDVGFYSTHRQLDPLKLGCCLLERYQAGSRYFLG